MDRASSGVIRRPFNRTIRLIASSQPAGVERSKEIRPITPLASRAWHVPHLEITRGSVTGMPSSGGAGVAAAAGPLRPCACAGTVAQNTAATNTVTGRLLIQYSLLFIHSTT